MDTWNWIFGIFHFHSTPGDIHPLPLPLICLCTGSVNLTRTSSYTFLGFLDYSNAYLSHNIHTFKQHRLELCDLNDGLWPLSTNRPSISISPHLLNRALYTPAFFLVSFPPLRLCRLISPNSRSLVHLFLFPYTLNHLVYLHIIFFSSKSAILNPFYCLLITCRAEDNVCWSQSSTPGISYPVLTSTPPLSEHRE